METLTVWHMRELKCSWNKDEGIARMSATLGMIKYTYLTYNIDFFAVAK